MNPLPKTTGVDYTSAALLLSIVSPQKKKKKKCTPEQSPLSSHARPGFEPPPCSQKRSSRCFVCIHTTKKGSFFPRMI